MILRWLVRSALVMIPLFSLLGCAADTTAPISSDSAASGSTVKATPNTLKGVAGSLFAGTTGVVFSVNGAAIGESYYWTVTGSLPPGLAFFPPTNSAPSPTLTLFGTPSDGGLFPIQITVHTAPNHVQVGPTTNFPIEIAGDSNSAPAIQALAFTWLTGVTYQQDLTATGGKTPYASWFQTGLPAEITLDSKTGIISGTPSTPGTYNVTVSVLDAAGRLGIGTLSLTVKTWTLADAKGTWTGVIQTGPLANKRLGLLFNDVGVAQQGTMDTTILATTAQSLQFNIGTVPPYAGQFNGPIGLLKWHLVCTPTSSGALDCIGHDFSGANPNGSVTLTNIGASSQDVNPPAVVSNPTPFTSGAPDRVTVTFSELMSGTGTANTSITLSGTGTVGTPTFGSSDPTTIEARTLTIPLSQLQSNTNYVLTLNPTRTGFLDLAGNVLATTPITFTTATVGTNQPPTATSLTLSATVGTPRPITLTGSDPEGATLTFSIATPPTAGTLTSTAPNVSYTSNAIGRDSFTFTVSDGVSTSAQGTITIDTRAANQRPTAVAQTVAGVHDRPLAITLTGTDPDVGDYLTAYTIVSDPTHGTLKGTAGIPNAKTYTPTPNTGYVGGDSFTFTVTDSAGAVSAPTTVTINVTNQSPTATPQSKTVQKDVQPAITLAGTDPDGDTLTYTVPVSTTQGGTLSGTGATRTYTPPAGYSGPYPLSDIFSFTVSDGIPPDSAPAEVKILVSANPPPTANPQTFTFPTRQPTTPLYKAQFAITLTGSTSDPRGIAGFEIITWPSHLDDTGWTTDPSQSMNMVAQKTYQFVVVDPVVDPVTGTLSEGKAITTSSVNRTTGVITVTPTGSPFTIIYTPNVCHDIFPQDTFTFIAIDADGLASTPKTVTMNSYSYTSCTHF